MTHFSRIFRSSHRLLTVLTLAIATFFVVQPVQAERIKDIGGFAGLRTNQLVGYGVVVGLAGTGDDSLEYATIGLKGVTNRFGRDWQGKIFARRYADLDAAIWC